ncbi:hypothetical protein HPB48_009928 [Haemaphysalis longicornis]|uniref:Uncharacterized protein n=1 Tax=Haemaphysalis longicornis TaxID=44386 RepID=A0A9J6GT49_HAELO|nr:hypothetical protein HPB48_009928 [Haemaphysalis longicornis]
MGADAADSDGHSVNEAPNIQCNTCGWWVYLDETPYKDMKAAADGGDFSCRICRKIAEITEQMQVGECQQCSALGHRVATLESIVNEMAAKLQQQVSQKIYAVPRQDEQATTAVASQVEQATTQALEEPEAAALEERVQQPADQQNNAVLDRAADTSNTQPLQQETNAARERCPHGAAVQTVPAAEPKLCDGQTPPYGLSEIGHQTGICRQEKPKTGDGPANERKVHTGGDSTQPKRTHVSRGKRRGRNTVQVLRCTDECPPRGTLREVVVIGDNNVGLMAATVGEVVAEPNTVEIIYSRNATMAEAVKYATEYHERARCVPRQYILHAGLQDVLWGNPDEMTNALDSMPTGRPGTLTICSIPEITSRGDETRAAVVLANARIKKWSRKTNSRFLNLNKSELAISFAKDGLSYDGDGAQTVGCTVGRVAKRFLDPCRPPRRESATQTWKKPREERQTSRRRSTPKWNPENENRNHPSIRNQQQMPQVPSAQTNRNRRKKNSLTQLIETALESVLSRQGPGRTQP